MKFIAHSSCLQDEVKFSSMQSEENKMASADEDLNDSDSDQEV